MISSGIITRDITVGDNIQLNIDFEQADLLASALNELIIKNLDAIFSNEKASALHKLNDVLAAACNQYSEKFSDNELRDL